MQRVREEANILYWGCNAARFDDIGRTYRVSHIETNDSKWLWEVEGSIIFLNYGAQWLQEDCTFVFYQPVFKKMTLAGLNSLFRKSVRYQWKIGFFTIYSTNRDLYWSFGFWGWSNHQDQHFFLMKWGCWGHWGHWGCWGRWGHWGCRSFKAWKTTTEDFRVILAFKFSFIFMFKKSFLGVES